MEERLFSFRKNDGIKVPSFTLRPIDINVFGICIRIEFFKIISYGLVKMGHHKDTGSMQCGIWTNNFEIFHFSIRKEVHWHTSHGQMEAIGVTLPIDEVVFMGCIREGEKIGGHVSVGFIKGFTGFWIVSEEKEVLSDIKEGGSRKGNQKK